MSMVLWVPPLSAAVAALASLVPGWRAARLSGVVVSVLLLACGIALVLASRGGGVPVAVGGLLRADALSAYMLAVVGAVGLTATWGGLRPAGSAEPSDRAYAALVALFLGAMSLAVLADNLGVLWVAVEATTIATAFLVGHHHTRHSLEAAWKYVVLGSVGVAIALLGIVLLYAATREAGIPTLSWVVLDQTSADLDPTLVKVAAGLAALGFATKAGLAPMHSWLPDAHSQAPAPVSGLMSGVLLAVAFYAILRVQAIADAAVGAGFMRGMLVVGGLLSLTVAAALLLRQRDYKRMLAYSSIEHMGLLALGAAAGGALGLTAVLLHVLGHGLSKASLFVVSGRILQAEGTTTIAEVRGLLARRPGLAIPFLVGMAWLLGLPPSALFFSEVAIILALWQAGLSWVAGLALALLLVLFAGLIRLTFAISLGSGPRDTAEASDRSSYGPRAPLVLALGVTAVVAFLATPVGAALARASAVLGGGV
jgi:formate hydrogenlyase subunit 3/multisubunit Na+/H+ antiporter MnhD subunit